LNGVSPEKAFANVDDILAQEPRKVNERFWGDSGFYLELKFKAQNLSRLKSAWAISPEIYFRINAEKYGNLRFSASVCVL